MNVKCYQRIKNLKVVGNEFLIKKKEELETLVNSIKEKIDISLHGYLEIFLDAQVGDNTIEIIKRNLVNKLDEQELQQLSIKKVEIAQLEQKLTNLRNQDQQQTQTCQIVQLSP